MVIELKNNDEYKSIQGCVYKVIYNDRYIIVMGKTFIRSITSIHNDINRFLKGVGDGKSQSNIYLKFYQYIIDNRGFDFTIEMILQSNSGYQLLKCCQIELSKGKNDENCLNSQFAPYINKDIQRPKQLRSFEWWINRGSYLNFRNWQRKHIESN